MKRASASTRIALARVLAVRRCSERDHAKPVRGGGPCQACLRWSDRRADELVAAGVLRTETDDLNAEAIARLAAMLNRFPWNWPWFRPRRAVLSAVRGVLLRREQSSVG